MKLHSQGNSFPIYQGVPSVFAKISGYEDWIAEGTQMLEYKSKSDGFYLLISN